MRKILFFAAFLAVTAVMGVRSAHAAGPVDDHLGSVLIDVSSHGEAWWVNPATRMRVFLGRPSDALERLTDRAVMVNWSNIARLSDADPAQSEAGYAAAVAGQVLAPNDLIGAAWYVDPSTGLRMRLAVPSDAWEIMRSGVPVAAETLAGIPVEPEGDPRIVEAEVKDVRSATVLELADGSEVSLISIDVPSNPELQEAAMSRIRELAVGKTVVLERDVKRTDAAGRKLRFVHAGPVNLNLDLVRRGLAFHDIGFPNVMYAEQLIVAGIDASRHGNGFWYGAAATE